MPDLTWDEFMEQYGLGNSGNISYPPESAIGLAPGYGGSDAYYDSLGIDPPSDYSIPPAPSYEDAFSGINSNDLWGDSSLGSTDFGTTPNYVENWADSQDGGGGGAWSSILGVLKGIGSNPDGTKAASPWGSLGNAIGGTTGKTIGNAVGAGIDLAGLLKQLTGTSETGQKKLDATQIQQTIEKHASGIEKQVNAGTMNPGVALNALKNLAKLAYTYTGNSYDARGMLQALSSVNQIIANVQSTYNNSMAKGVSNGTLNKKAAGGLTDNFSDPGQQTDWIKQQMKNKLTGFSAGDENLAGSPLEKLFKPAFDIKSQLGPTMNKVKEYVPDYKEPTAFDSIRKRLEGGI